MYQYVTIETYLLTILAVVVVNVLFINYIIGLLVYA